MTPKFQLFIAFIFLFLTSSCGVQKKYTKSIETHRTEYKADFVRNEHSPLKEEDLPFLRFYEANKDYVVTADFERTPDEKPFDMATYSGVTRPYLKYGVASFMLKDTLVKIAIYQSLQLIKMPQYKEHLFMPFNDATNSNTTYGGGRYIDLSKSDIVDGKIVLDFNKVYNPYCAYSDGYNCPIPPKENQLNVAIEAGEKMFEGEYKGEH